MTSICDYEDADGKVDWDRYHAAQVASGDTCKSCGKYIMNIRLFGPAREPGPQDCTDCKDIKTNANEITHDSLVRCPKCQHRWNPGECDDYRLYNEGTNDAWCGECDHKFEIETLVQYSFASPALIKENNDG